MTKSARENDRLVLDSLRSGGPMSVRDLATATGVLQQAVYASVDRLRDDGLVAPRVWGRGLRGAALFEAIR